MVRKLLNILQKSKLTLAGITLLVALSAAGSVSMVHPATAAAAACDPVNIIYCGLDGSTAAGYINSFQADYQNGSNAGHDDLKVIYRWAGATNTSVANMNTTNTKVGTLYRNGDIKVDGRVVGHDAWVAARFGAGRPGFVQISPGVWARKTTTSLEHDTYKTIVHFDATGTADFAVMVDCGNAVKFTPTPPPPPPVQPHLACVSLSQVSTGERLTYSFTAQANAVATTIQSYTFTFTGGGATNTQTVNISAKNVTVTHTFMKNDTTYNVSVVIRGMSTDGTPITAPACSLNLTTPKVQECKPGIPVGDARCNECKPGVPVGDARCTECKPGVQQGDIACNPAPEVTPAAKTLVDTGPGSIIAVAGVTAVTGAFARYMYIRRKLGL